MSEKVIKLFYKMANFLKSSEIETDTSYLHHKNDLNQSVICRELKSPKLEVPSRHSKGILHVQLNIFRDWQILKID